VWSYRLLFTVPIRLHYVMRKLSEIISACILFSVTKESDVAGYALNLFSPRILPFNAVYHDNESDEKHSTTKHVPKELKTYN
jgi:hypothetical protein